jgi:hypothetical protein
MIYAIIQGSCILTRSEFKVMTASIQRTLFNRLTRVLTGTLYEMLTGSVRRISFEPLTCMLTPTSFVLLIEPVRWLLFKLLIRIVIHALTGSVSFSPRGAMPPSIEHMSVLQQARKTREV